jgi:hypothetical protein
LVDTDMNGVLSEAVHAHPGSVRTSNSTCAPAAGTFTVNQGQGCTFTLVPTSATALSSMRQ